jgi:CRP-like cAMP-binding protein
MLKISNLHNWLSPLPNEILAEIESLMSVRTLVDGEALYHLGDKANELYQVVEGVIKCNMHSHDGKEVVIATFLSGDTFGELGLLDGLPRAANTLAVGNTTIRTLNKKNFNRLSLKYPEINAQLLVMFSHRMRMAFTINTDSLTLTLNKRLARYIHRIAVSRSVNENNDNDVLIDISHEELGRILGASRQSISKELKQMEKDGLLEIKYGKVIIKGSHIFSSQYDYLIGHDQITPDYSEE